MSFIHDIIKIEFVNTGYLPNYPYHLISDEEMFNAFIREPVIDTETGEKELQGFFADFYPLPDTFEDPELIECYTNLKDAILEKIKLHLENPETNPIPYWIYSYMMFRPITFESDELDIAYLYSLIPDIENKNGVYLFTEEIAYNCYVNSVDWLKRQHSKNIDRPPTIFGETHVTKSLRLAQANIFLDEGST